MQSPSAKTRLLGLISKLGLSSSKPEQASQQRIFSQISTHLTALQAAIAASLAKTLSAVRSQWYRMAVGDTNIDRTLCIGLGYFVIIAGAGVYLHLSQNRPAREAGAAVRDHIKHNFTMVKVGFFVFPSTHKLQANFQ